MHTIRPGNSVKLTAVQQLWGLALGGVVLLFLGIVISVSEKDTRDGGSAGWAHFGWFLAGVGAAMVVVVLTAVGTILGRHADT